MIAQSIKYLEVIQEYVKFPHEKIYFNLFLLVHNCCTGGFVVTFPCMSIMYQDWFHPHHYSPSCPSPLLKMIDRFQCSIFIHERKGTTHTQSTLFMYPSCPTGTLPHHDLFHIPVLHCSSVCSLFKEVCHGILIVF
jgi:hypothetical protein